MPKKTLTAEEKKARRDARKINKQKEEERIEASLSDFKKRLQNIFDETMRPLDKLIAELKKKTPEPAEVVPISRRPIGQELEEASNAA